MENDLMRAKDKAEESDRLKTAFLNNMSHEIRTPLNAIAGFSEILNTEKNDQSDIQFYTSIIQQSSNQLLSIIDDIVDIALIEVGQVRIINKEVNINQVLNNILEQFRVKISEKDLILKIEKTLPESKVILITDEIKLNQILSNIIVNAIKFTETGWINIGCELIGNDLLFYIQDNGIGIPAELHEKIFERFRQAELSVARKYGGTGLGLSILKSYVELLGGEIWLKSESGKGSTFYFTLPIIQPENSLSAISTKSEIVFNKKSTILVAEDEDFNYLLIEKILTNSNISILRVLNGLVAVELCRKHPEIDLVLMDIKMPELNGFEATSRIKNIRPELPVISITALVQAGIKEDAAASFCDDYIAKPFSREDLIRLIFKYLNK